MYCVWATDILALEIIINFILHQVSNRIWSRRLCGADGTSHFEIRIKCCFLYIHGNSLILHVKYSSLRLILLDLGLVHKNFQYVFVMKGAGAIY
jgi:hypothetical protein